MQHINDITEPPVIGRMYKVPCVELAGQWWPIHGPRHADPDLGVPTEHYHYDGRFMTAQQVNANLVGLRRTERLFGGCPSVFAHGYVEPTNEAIQIVHIVGEAEQIEDRPLRCVRQAVTFPRAEPLLEAMFAEHKSDCRTCPHRGMRIDQQPADDRGGVVCPGHGLRWHRPSGRLMPRKEGGRAEDVVELLRTHGATGGLMEKVRGLLMEEAARPRDSAELVEVADTGRVAVDEPHECAGCIGGGRCEARAGGDAEERDCAGCGAPPNIRCAKDCPSPHAWYDGDDDAREEFFGGGT